MKLKYDILLSSFAFNCKLRRFTLGVAALGDRIKLLEAAREMGDKLARLAVAGVGGGGAAGTVAGETAAAAARAAARAAAAGATQGVIPEARNKVTKAQAEVAELHAKAAAITAALAEAEVAVHAAEQEAEAESTAARPA